MVAAKAIFIAALIALAGHQPALGGNTAYPPSPAPTYGGAPHASPAPTYGGAPHASPAPTYEDAAHASSTSHGDTVHASGHTDDSHGGGHVKPASVFGIISDLQVSTATVVFLLFILFIVVLEFLVKQLEHWADKRGLKALVEKMQKELMVMGVISFVIFMFENFSDDPVIEDHTSGKFLSFEMAHVIVLFMAFGFVCQASFLVYFAQHHGKKYMNAMRQSVAKLNESVAALVPSSWDYRRFHQWSPLVPFVSQLRQDIEFRIIGRYFTRAHSLPAEFDFANYVNRLFMVYLAELGEVCLVS